MKNADERFPAASAFFMNHFHQDYEGRAEDVVARFAREHGIPEREALILDFEKLLDRYAEEELQRMVDGRFLNAFDVTRFKTSYRSWIQQMIAIIRSTG